MSGDLKAVTVDAWPTWLEAIGGGVDVSFNGATAVKGIRVYGSAVTLGREHNAPQAGSVRLLTDEIGTLTEDGSLTVDGTRVFITAIRPDAAGAVTVIEYTASQPVPPELA